MRIATNQEVQDYLKVQKDLIAKIRTIRGDGVRIIDARDLVFASVGVKTIRDYMEHHGVYVKAVNSPRDPTEYFYYG